MSGSVSLSVRTRLRFTRASAKRAAAQSHLLPLSLFGLLRCWIGCWIGSAGAVCDVESESLNAMSDEGREIDLVTVCDL